MLFNTFAFSLGFLPLALGAYFLLSKHSLRLSVAFLFLASLAFYSYWDVTFLPLLLGSIAVNYYVGRWIRTEKESARDRKAKRALLVGLIFNLGVLGFFKYADFFYQNVASLLGANFAPLGIKLPIGISFFTFTQIAYLVDCYACRVREYEPESYGLFVTYFPHLIAGPILHHKEMMPQFDRPDTHVFSSHRLVIGSVFFLIGLFKKIVLADGIARFVSPVFDVNYASLTVLESWCGALAYTFQLYFDFSAYCDMAYGLSYMFGIVLPLNFNSPYKATSIIDFWRRWHITLSRFLRDYLYIPLGGSRHGSGRRYVNLLITMLLGGLWHGANWTFVVWGGLHGCYLACNHMLRHYVGEQEGRFGNLVGWALTFLAVVIGWVFFRAESLEIALAILRAMAFGTYEPAVGSIVEINRIMALDQCVVWLAVLAAIAFFLPNPYELIGHGARKVREGAFTVPRRGFAFGFSVTLMLVLLAISETRGVSEFLYFNF